MWYDRILSKSVRKHLLASQLLKCGSTLTFEVSHCVPYCLVYIVLRIMICAINLYHEILSS